MVRIKVIGESDCAKATRGLLRQAGFAVTEFLPAEAVMQGPLAGYVIAIGQVSGTDRIQIDSIDCPLEAAILKHITQLSNLPVVVDRPGGAVHSDREIAVGVPEAPEQQHAVEFGILRGLLQISTPANAADQPAGEPDTAHSAPRFPQERDPEIKRVKSWYERIFS